MMKRTADSGHILLSVCNFRLEHFLGLPNQTSEPKDPSILRFTQTDCKYLQIIVVQHLARQGILINCRLGFNRDLKRAIHSTKISGLRFENFLVSNGSRQVRKGLVSFHSQNDFRANVDHCCSNQS